MRRVAVVQLAGLTIATLVGSPGIARAQLFGKLQEKVEDAAEKVVEAKETADRFGSAVVPVSTAQEIEIGRGIAATVAGHYGVVRDTALTRYVNLVGSAVATTDPRPDVAYRFAVLDTDEVNAFAAPGGYVFVTRGALGLMKDEAMLAGVLAHEIGHVNARDVIEEIQSKARTALGIEEAAERVDITGEAYLRKAVETGATALFVGLSREDEIAADVYGVEVAGRTGYDAGGLERFVEALERRHGHDDVSLLEKTHPDPDERLEAIEAAIDGLPPTARGRVSAAARFERATEDGR